MPRNGDEARRRLREATLALFLERGYDATTTAEIAARAGVTERTFFRHFPDKREALFDGEEAFRDALVAGVLAAPKGLGPLDAVMEGFRAVAPMGEANRASSGPRNRLFAETPALRERVLTKQAALTAALAAALQRRGVEAGSAALAAQVGMAVFSHAAAALMADPTAKVEDVVARSFTTLRGLSGG
jgi:AcrR family transcriptional regulator